MGKPVLNIAHRGASGYVRENTAEAIEKAIELGADMVEFDLRRTSDGIIVLWHDRSIPDSRGVRIPLSSISYEDLCQYANGFGFMPARFDRILMDFGSRIAFDIEIKVGGFEREIMDLLKKYPPLFSPTIASFFPGVISRVKKLDRALRTGLIVGKKEMPKFRALSKTIVKFAALKTDADSVHLNHDIADSGLINELTDSEIDVYIWTVNDEDDMRKFISFNVGGIISDKPDLLKSVIRDSAEPERDLLEEGVG